MNYKPYPWWEYSKSLANRILAPKSVGSFSADETRGMRLVIGEEGEIEEGNIVRIYLLVDEEDGIVADARFQAFGETALIGAADVACELSLRKNYDQVMRFTADLLDLHVRDKKNSHAFPAETYPYLNFVLSAVEQAAQQCTDLPLPTSYVPPSVDFSSGEPTEIPNWKELSKEQQIALIEEVLTEQIRPYIELDEGGVRIIDLKGDEVLIAYEGNCTSCYSAIGGTLNAIQEVLRRSIYPHLIVTPDIENLSIDDVSADELSLFS